MQEQSAPDYGFIFNEAPKSKKSLLPGGGSKKQRILVVAAGGTILLMVIMLVFSFLFGNSSANIERLVQVAQAQTELIRVSEIGEKKARGPKAKNLAVTTKLSLQSSQIQLIEVIKKQGRKLNSSELSQTKNSQTDTDLTSAEQTNRFDEQFLEIMRSGLQDYQVKVRDAYNNASGRNEKAVLQTTFNEAKILAGTQE